MTQEWTPNAAFVAHEMSNQRWLEIQISFCDGESLTTWITQALAEGNRHIVLNLAGLVWPGDRGELCGILFQAIKPFRGRGEFALLNLPQEFHEHARLENWRHVFPIYSSEEEVWAQFIPASNR